MIILGLTSLLAAFLHWCIAHISSDLAVRRTFRFKRSSRGSKAILATCPLVQEAGSKKKTGSDFPEGSYSLEQLAGPRVQHAGVSRTDRHLFTAPNPPHLLPAGKDDPHPMHKYSLPSGAAEPTDLCTTMISVRGLLLLCPGFSILVQIKQLEWRSKLVLD